MTVALAPRVEAERLSLSKALAEAPPGQEAAPGFTAWLEGQPYEVTAVLERTAVIVRPGEEKRLKRFSLLEVDEGALRWRPTGSTYGRWVRLADVADLPVSPEHQEVEADRADQTQRSSAAQDDLPPDSPLTEAVGEGPSRVDPCDQEDGRGHGRSEQLPEPELEQLPRPVADEVTAMGAPDPGSCDRCGRRLRKDNRRGRCVRCRRGEAIGPAPTASIENLPDRVQDLVDQFIRVSCYARDLEEELDRRREDGRQMKILGRRVQAALAVVADRETPVAMDGTS